ncbi:MAG TPA: hypothetical protein VGT78_07400 [Rhizomicrobium sp.]|nr:hypothetical protein [Rhizomicrobium sp.]
MRNRTIMLAAAIGGALLLGMNFAALADDDTPVPMPCNPEDCGPVPVEPPGCDENCTPAPDPGTAPGGPIEPDPSVTPPEPDPEPPAPEPVPQDGQ